MTCDKSKDKISFFKENISSFDKRIKKIEKEKQEAQRIIGDNIMDDFYDMRINLFENGKERFRKLLEEATKD